MDIHIDDKVKLSQAVDLLENSGLAMRITNYLGKPIEKSMKMLPEKVTGKIQQASIFSINKALKIATLSINTRLKGKKTSNTWHKVLSGTSGAVGGFLGLPGFIVELPVSTAIIMRSILDIARSFAENIENIDTQLACLEVFALGGKGYNKSGQNSEEMYYAVRASFAKSVTDAAKYIAAKGVADESAPVIIKLIAQISSRFGITVSEKFCAQIVPVLGGIGGAGINLLFLNHFQDMAKGHFIIRELERNYDKELIENEYRKLVK